MKPYDTILEELRENMRAEPDGGLRERLMESARADAAAPRRVRGGRRIGMRTALIAAVAAVFSLTTAFAYGSQIIQLLGGGRIEAGKTSSGEDYISISTGFTSDPAEVRDGRVYFILDGSDTDITNYCTEATYYEYAQMTDNGYRHVVIVGGTPDKLGWGEFIWDEKGNLLGSNATAYTDANDEKPQWLRIADETLRN
ncbi:MAG: hypothetical protein LBH95_07335 [Oscillospiraceae bacterium]|jgi:hypothetical protein|nr:hypothetical protein [Oscillospiraceae bacterium]